MIVTEYFSTRKDGVNLYRTYSNINKFIHKEGEEFLYTDVIDVEDAPWVYIETDIDIPPRPYDGTTTENSDATVE